MNAVVKPEDTAPLEISGLSEEEVAKATALIKSGFDNEASPDEIKSKLFEQGIAFSNIARVYRLVTVHEDLVVDPAVVKAEVMEKLNAIKKPAEAVATIEMVDKLVESLCNNVKGAKPGKVMGLIRSWAKGQEIELPKKPAGGGGGKKGLGKLKTRYIDMFAGNKNLTREEFQAGLADAVKTEKNAKDYTDLMYDVLRAVANGMTSDQIIAEKAESKS